MNVYERIGRFLIADVAALLVIMATVIVLEVVAPAVPVAGPLVLEYVGPIAIVVGFLAWVKVMAP